MTAVETDKSRKDREEKEKKEREEKREEIKKANEAKERAKVKAAEKEGAFNCLRKIQEGLNADHTYLNAHDRTETENALRELNNWIVKQV